MASRINLSNQLPRVVHLLMNIMTPKSGLFLACSCVAAIAAVGSIFELSSGQPDLGNQTTSIILALSIPLTGLFFFAAVKDARAKINK